MPYLGSWMQLCLGFNNLSMSCLLMFFLNDDVCQSELEVTCLLTQVGNVAVRWCMQLPKSSACGFQKLLLLCAQVSVLEMDGQFDKLEELIYIESHLSNTSAKFYGEITQQMLKNSHFPGSNNGTGLFQTICGLKLREVYEALIQQEVKPVV